MRQAGLGLEDGPVTKGHGQLAAGAGTVEAEDAEHLPDHLMQHTHIRAVTCSATRAHS